MSSFGGAGFPRGRRIRRSVEFRELNQRSSRLSSQAFVMRVAAGETPEGRLGLTVSRKVGNAVVRNRVKRRVRDWFRREAGAASRGLDLVVIARPAAARLGRGATAPELSGLLERRR